MVKTEFTCDELSDIYMSLVSMVAILGKSDLITLRDKIADIIARECGEVPK